MSRYIKNTVVLMALEAVAGVDIGPTGADDAVLVSEMSITPLDAQNIDRNLVRGYFGASEQLVGPASVKISFSVELAGSGVAATPPAWGKLLLACAAGEGLLTGPARVEYTPVSSGLKTATCYYFDDGVLHKAVGVMGNAMLSAKVGARPMLKFEFVGLDAGISAANDSPVFTAWKTPVAMTKANVIDIKLGSNYAVGALTGGTDYASTGLDMNFGNTVNFTPLLSSETVDITDRQSTGTVELELTAAQEVALMASVKANQIQSLAIGIGLVAGNKIIVHAPAVQLLNPKKVDLNGKRLIGYDLRFVPTPTGTGNDEWRIVTQ